MKIHNTHCQKVRKKATEIARLKGISFSRLVSRVTPNASERHLVRETLTELKQHFSYMNLDWLASDLGISKEALLARFKVEEPQMQIA